MTMFFFSEPSLQAVDPKETNFSINMYKIRCHFILLQCCDAVCADLNVDIAPEKPLIENLNEIKPVLYLSTNAQNVREAIRAGNAKKFKWVQEVIYSIKYNKNVTSISFYNF